MGEYNKTYKPHKIPGQMTLFENKDTQKTSEITSSISFDNHDFAEIDIGEDYTESSIQTEPIPQNPVIDEKRELFYKMRQISYDNYAPVHFRSNFYNKHVQHNNSVIFYQQAEFMKDFEDDYEGNVPFSSYFPYYQLMNYEQLRTYFTWRTRVRNGKIDYTSLSYAFVYIYELINNIGVDTPEDGLNKLMTFWNAFKKYDHSLDKYIIKWIKDYHIYYELPKSFKEFVCKNNIQTLYPKVFLYESDSNDNFTLFCSISKYDIKQSVFYNSDEETRDLINHCFYFVINRLKHELESVNINFDELIFHTTKKLSAWTPFHGALFYPWFHSPDKTVVLSDKEIYICSQNKWSFSTTITMESGRQLVGYIMKQMESSLRNITNYKYKLSANTNMIKGTIIPITLAHGIFLEKLIDDSVLEYYKEINKVVVSVSETSLSQIRKEAFHTQEKLIVPENEEITNTKEHELAHTTPMQIQESPILTFNESDSVPDDWANLKNTLNSTELNALSVILQNGNMKQFADEHSIMLEVLADSINEKAVDCIGDNILELDINVIIYEDYIENVMEMVNNHGE